MKMPSAGNDSMLPAQNGLPNDASNKSSFLRLTSFLLSNNSGSRNNSASDSPSNGITSNPMSPIDGSETLNSLHSRLDHLLSDGSDDSESNSEWSSEPNDSKYVPIKRSHWKEVAKVRCCDKCHKDFRFGNRKYNCRRCGNVFCDTCCQYRKRLSPDGIPDSQGNVYRVCRTCADMHIQEIGVTRSLTNLFHEQRKNKRLLIEDELKRLIDGFEENVDPNSPFKSAIDTLPTFIVPYWQKSSKWLDSSEVEWCAKCSSNFNFLNRKHHCRLCGYIFCTKCCNTSLLLYFDENQKAVAKLIGVVGCPDKEPSISLYLNVCIVCEEDLEEYQVQQYYFESTNSVENSRDNMEKLQGIIDRLNTIEKKIKESLPSFQEQLVMYEFEGNPNKNIDGKNNMELFAKAHSDISDLFTKYSVTIQGLKEINMSSKIELKLMRNIISVKCNQYTSDMNMFKSLRCKMNETFPPKSLEQFQNFANKHAINNTYIMTRQLGLEALNLSLRYEFQTTLAEKLSEADHVCFTELENYLESIGEDQKRHIDVLNDLLKVQMKEKTLVVPNKKKVETGGSEYVDSFLIHRCSTVLYQILKALQSKSSETQFPQSKQSLQELLDFVSNLNVNGKNRL